MQTSGTQVRLLASEKGNLLLSELQLHCVPYFLLKILPRELLQRSSWFVFWLFGKPGEETTWKAFQGLLREHRMHRTYRLWPTWEGNAFRKNSKMSPFWFTYFNCVLLLLLSLGKELNWPWSQVGILYTLPFSKFLLFHFSPFFIFYSSWNSCRQSCFSVTN